MVKNLHASAGDPGPGIFHVPTEQLSHALKLASLHSGVCELQLLRPTCPKAHGLQLEKLEHCDLRGACAAAMRTLCYQKKKKSFKIPRNKGLSVLAVHCLWVWRAGMQERKGSLCELGRAFC